MVGANKRKIAAYGAMLAVLAVIAGLLWGTWDVKAPSLNGPEKPGVVQAPGAISVGSTTGAPVQPISAVGPLGPGGTLGPGGPMGPASYPTTPPPTRRIQVYGSPAPNGPMGPKSTESSTSTATSATMDSE